MIRVSDFRKTACDAVEESELATVRHAWREWTGEDE